MGNATGAVPLAVAGLVRFVCAGDPVPMKISPMVHCSNRAMPGIEWPSARRVPEDPVALALAQTYPQQTYPQASEYGFFRKVRQ